jgi:hypothetical protein
VALIRLDVERRPLLGGVAFGEVGAYEELRGEAEFAVDPTHPLNAPIVDLDLAPRDADGRVHFSADIRILRPVDARRGNGGIYLDVVNRGTSIFPRMLEPGPMGPTTGISEGFLMRRGFTVVSCGWQHDVPRGGERFGLTAPEALVSDTGGPIEGDVTVSFQPDAATDTLSLDATTYRPLDPASATLTERDGPSDASRVVPRAEWFFTDELRGVEYAGTFAPGRIYDLTFRTAGAPVTGVGFLALRDVLAYLRKTEAARFAIALGASQSGRLLRQMVYLGMCEGEDGGLVLDGVLAVAAGARMTEANWRYGQPGAQGPTSAVFPHTDLSQTDAQSGRIDGLQRRAETRNLVPRVIHLNTSSEYCSSAAIEHLSAALSHLTVDGTRDVAVPDNVRIYLCASTQHAPSALPLAQYEPTLGSHWPNTIDYKPFVRACVDNLTAWVTRDEPAPPSAYPRLDDGTLDAEGLRSAVDADGNELAGLRHPDVVVPLATYTGFNPRRPEAGGPERVLRATGSTLPLSPSAIAERYPSREAFLTQVRAAAEGLAQQRYLLQKDVDSVVAASAQRWDEFVALPTESPIGWALTGGR